MTCQPTFWGSAWWTCIFTAWGRSKGNTLCCYPLVRPDHGFLVSSLTTSSPPSIITTNLNWEMQSFRLRSPSNKVWWGFADASLKVASQCSETPQLLFIKHYYLPYWNWHVNWAIEMVCINWQLLKEDSVEDIFILNI